MLITETTLAGTYRAEVRAFLAGLRHFTDRQPAINSADARRR
jgi:hypothetical protein